MMTLGCAPRRFVLVIQVENGNTTQITATVQHLSQSFPLRFCGCPHQKPHCPRTTMIPPYFPRLLSWGGELKSIWVAHTCTCLSMFIRRTSCWTISGTGSSSGASSQDEWTQMKTSHQHIYITTLVVCRPATTTVVVAGLQTTSVLMYMCVSLYNYKLTTTTTKTQLTNTNLHTHTSQHV